MPFGRNCGQQAADLQASIAGKHLPNWQRELTKSDFANDAAQPACVARHAGRTSTGFGTRRIVKNRVTVRGDENVKNRDEVIPLAKPSKCGGDCAPRQRPTSGISPAFPVSF
jgi:hypothetical protein